MWSSVSHVVAELSSLDNFKLVKLEQFVRAGFGNHAEAILNRSILLWQLTLGSELDTFNMSKVTTNWETKEGIDVREIQSFQDIFREVSNLSRLAHAAD